MQYLSCAETAKMVRAALKEAFPDIKFGVRSHTYSGGASIRVSWADGPNTRQVESIAKTFCGSYFDGMIDYKGSLNHMVNGQQVSFGADFIFCEREHSDAAIGRAIDAVIRSYGPRDWKAEPTVANYRRGLLWDCCPSGPGYFDFGRALAERLSKVSDRFAPAKSNTAAKVIFLGNDGYSQHGALDGATL